MGGLEFAGLIIPVLILLTLLEYGVSRYKKQEVYSLADTLVNASCGLLERLFDFFFVVFLYFLFDFFFHHVAPWQIPANPWTWILALLVGDFLAYWHHRLSHEINFFWAAHIVHHQSEELNMTTVFRVSAFAVINRTFFWIWMPILGFSPIVATSVIVFIGLYQFVTHTRLVGKLGVLEYFLVTPSHHRVHHARNEKYIDKNYGHVFIFWDKLFGTFEPEEEEPEYGIITGFESSSPYWAYFSYWSTLFRRARQASNWKNKVKLFLMPPAWENEDVPHLPYTVPLDQYGNRKKYRLWLPFKLGAYVTSSLVGILGVFIFLLTEGAELDTPLKILFAVLLACSLVPLGPLMEQKEWGVKAEFVRLLAWIFCGAVLFWLQVFSPWLIVSTFGLLPVVQFLWLIRLRRNFGYDNQVPFQSQTS
jgi:alkylglycerol monooxygenase